MNAEHLRGIAQKLLLMTLCSVGLTWFSGVVCAEESALAHLSSGDTLPGIPLAADGSTVTWKSPLFQSPVTFEKSALRRIRFTPGEPPPASESDFRALLRNGDVLFGQLVAITPEHVRLLTSRFGELLLRRDNILTLQRGGREGVISTNALSLENWRVSSPPWPEASPNSPSSLPPVDWVSETSALITSTRSGAWAFLPLNLTDRFEIDFEIVSPGSPSFSLMIGPPAKSSLQIDTWLDSLVLTQSEATFDELRLITPGERVVRLRLFVDYIAKKASVYDVSGKLLGEIPAVRDWKEGGITLRQRDLPVTLRRMQVLHWQGAFPAASLGHQALISLENGESIAGELEPFQSTDGRLRVKREDSIREMALAEVRSLIVSAEAPILSPQSNLSTFAWSDGTVLTGTLLDWRDHQLRIQTTAIEQPLLGTATGLANWEVGGAVPVDPGPDTLFHAQGKLRGSLELKAAPSPPLTFRPAGATQGVALRNELDARLVRTSTAQRDRPQSWADYPQTLSLRNRDRLPVRILAANEAAVLVESPLFSASAIPLDEVDSLDFNTSPDRLRSGFDLHWQRPAGGSPEVLDLAPGQQAQHPAVLSGGQANFTLSWPATGTHALRVSAARANKLPVEVWNFSLSPNEISFDFPMPPTNSQREARGNRILSGRRPRGVDVAGTSANIDLAEVPAGWRLRIGDQEWTMLKLLPESAEPVSLRFELLVAGSDSSLKPAEGTLPVIRITNFAAATSPNQLLAFSTSEMREMALTVPREKQPTPPQHLLISPAGDLLRGRLIDVDRESIRFQAGAEPLRLERSRVATISRLHPPPKEKLTEVVTNSVSNAQAIQLVLGDGDRLTLQPTAGDGKTLRGTSIVLGECHIDPAQITEIWLGNPAQFLTNPFQNVLTLRAAAEPKWDIPAESPNIDELLGRAAAEFSLPMLDGTRFDVRAHQSEVLVLDFWASWAGPCHESIPETLAALSEYDASRVRYIGINVSEPADVVRKHLASHNLDFAVALDRDGAVSKQFKAGALPHLVILNRGNVVENVRIGHFPGAADQLTHTITSILDGTWQRPPTNASAKP